MAKILEFITELIGWFQIVLSPLLIGVTIGTIIYFNRQDDIGLTLGITVAVITLIVGVVLATRFWKKKGTVNFISRIDAFTELNNSEEINANEKKITNRTLKQKHRHQPLDTSSIKADSPENNR